MLQLQLIAIPFLLASSAGCSEPSATNGPMLVPAAKEASTAMEGPDQAPVAGLPFAQGRSFGTLDEYLAFLKERGAQDIPWYREVSPGVFELVSRRVPGKAPPTFTREQLKERFGFKG